MRRTTGHTTACIWALILLVAGSVFALSVESGAETGQKEQRKSSGAKVEAKELQPVTEYGVTMDGATLFTFRKGYRAYTAEERASATTERIRKMADDFLVSLDSITVTDHESTAEIAMGDRVILSLSDGDAKATGKKITRQELAGEYAERLRVAMVKHREEFSRRSVVRGGIYLVVATILAGAALFLLHIFYRRFYGIIAVRLDTRIRSIQIQSLEIIQAERIKALIIGAVKVLRFAVILSILYVYTYSALTFFPWTKPFAATALEYVLLPLRVLGRAFLKQIPNLFFLAVLIVITWYILKLMRLFFVEIERKSITIPGFYPEWGMPTHKICRLLLVALMAVIAFPYIPGSNSPAFKGISIFLGVLFSIGSSATLSNVIAGFAMTYRRAFAVGDRVKIGDFTGDVTEIRLQVTHIRTPKNEEVIVPNSVIMNSHIINYSMEARKEGLILYASVTIGYDAPWRKIHELLISAALATEDILKTPAPFVLQTALNDFYVTYEINAYTDAPNRTPLIYSRLYQNIQDKFNEGGVEIMSPHYTQVRDGSHTTIPVGYLPEDYTPAGIRVSCTGAPDNKGGKGA